MCDFQRIHSNGLALSIKPFTIKPRTVARRDLDLAPILAAFAPKNPRLPNGVESKTMRLPLTASISASISARSVELGIQIFLHRRWRRFYAARHSETRAGGPFCPCHARMPQAQGWSSLLAMEGQPSSCAYTTIRSRILNLGPHLGARHDR
jgi:hypothetical protein